MRLPVDRRRFVLALAGWLVVTALAWAALGRVYNRVLAAAASLLGAAAPPGLSFTALGNDILARLHPLSLGEAGQTAFSGMQFHYNLVILIALILASSWLAWPRRLLSLPPAILALLVTHAVTLWLDTGQRFIQHGLVALPGGLADDLLGWAVIFFKGIGPLLFPLLVWAVACWRPEIRDWRLEIGD